MKLFSKSQRALLMSYRVSPREIEKTIKRLQIPHSGNLRVIASNDIRVCAVQPKLRQYTSAEHFVQDINSYVAKAVNQRAQLICFPGYMGLFPLSLIPGFGEIQATLASLPENSPNKIRTLHNTLTYFSDFVYNAYYHTLAGLAAAHGVYIMAGSAVYFEDAALFHRAFLFSDTGDLVGFQDKVAASPLETELSIPLADELKVFDTPLGRLALLIGNDAQYIEPARIAKRLGAQILLHASTSTQPPPPTPLLAPLGLRVQENLLYGVSCSGIGGEALGMRQSGGTTFFAPNELLAVKNGHLAKALNIEEGEVLAARLNLEQLAHLSNPFSQDSNAALYKKIYATP